jgi:hypothetical protein
MWRPIVVYAESLDRRDRDKETRNQKMQKLILKLGIEEGSEGYRN